MAASIATRTKLCTQIFRNTLDVLGNQNNPHLISSSNLGDALDRFQLWSGNIGASQISHNKTSLEARLQEAPDIRDQIIQLLEDLKEALEEIFEIFSGNRENRVETAEEFCEAGPEVDSAATMKSQQETISEVQEIFGIVLNCITGLFRMSIMIRKATPRDRFERALRAPEDPFNDRYDIAHVGEKYRKLNNPDLSWLKDRLGRAITKRRQYLRYCREHRKQLEKEKASTVHTAMEENVMAAPTQQAKSESHNVFIQSKPAVSQHSTKASTLNVAQYKANHEDSDDGRSNTSYASSIDVPEEPSSLQLPSLVELSGGGLPFECPFCQGIQSFLREKPWKQHAFRDLKPYVCCFSEKDCELRLFGDRNSWFDHELQNHRHQWVCLLCGVDPFRSYDKFSSHIHAAHPEMWDHLKDVTQASQQPLQLIPAIECPFCSDWELKLREDQMRRLEASGASLNTTDIILVNAQNFRRHVGLHMEQLALFAIPRGHEGSRDIQSNEPADGIASDDKSATSRSIGVVSHSSSWSPDPPLHVAAFQGNEDEIRRLLTEGTDINSRGETWGSALNAAIVASNYTTIELLLGYGADVNAESPFGTALEVARNNSCDSSIIDMLAKSAEIKLHGETFDINPETNISVIHVPRPSPTQRLREKSTAYIPLQYHLEYVLQECLFSDERFVSNYDQERLITVNAVAKEINEHSSSTTLEESRKQAILACKSAPHLFAILAIMNKGAEICSFLAEDVSDEDLPFELRIYDDGRHVLERESGKEIASFTGWTDDSLKDFYRYQWWMTAPVFEDLKHENIHENAVLPFTAPPPEIEKSKTGHYSTVYAARIHPSHHKFPLLKRLSPNKETHLIAVKKLMSSDRKDFLIERSILGELGRKPQMHIVKLLATYLYRNEYYLIFPYANANLRQFWKLYDSPQFDRITVLWSLRQMMGILNSLDTIHGLRVPSKFELEGEMRAQDDATLVGWASEEQYWRHGDIKPENILWFKRSPGIEDENGVLQIADFGSGRFHGRELHSNVHPTECPSVSSYEPPEPKLRMPISRAYDMWSIGCLFLEFITWLLRGQAAIEGFAKARGQADSRGNTDSNYFTITSNGERAVVRQDVIDWVNHLRCHERCSRVIHGLLDLIMKALLRVKPASRISPASLCARIEALYAIAEEDQESLLSPNLGWGKVEKN